ncbi:MAG: LytR/AlgR family response regulator transcription factor [Legionellales bacterium]
MITAIIIDDEQHCTDRLNNLLHENFKNDIELAGSFQNMEDGIAGIGKLQPDLVFLDVHIHNKTAFDLLEKLDRISFDLIFTTAHDKYAIQAFKFSAVDYLLKPIDKDDLRAAIDKLKEKKSVENTARKFDALFHNIKSTQTANKRVCIPVGNKLEVVPVSNIVRCESSGNYTNIYLKDQPKILVSKTLKEFEDMLGEYGFFRVHNSDLINLAYVKSYNKGKGGTVLMADNKNIEVSTRRKDDFLKRLAKM